MEEELDAWAIVAVPAPARPRVSWHGTPVEEVREVRTIALENREARVDDLTVEEEAVLAKQELDRKRFRESIAKKKDTWGTKPDSPRRTAAIPKPKVKPPEPLKINNVINTTIKEFVYPSGHIGDIVNVMFAPYLDRVMIRKDVVLQCPLERFKKKFKITSNVLDPIIEMWKNGERVILGGGKLIDFVNNKTLSESNNDYDIFHESDDNRWKFAGSLVKQYGFEETVGLSYLSEYISKPNDKYPALKVQNVHNVVACPEQLITSFDIRACAIACDGQNVYWVKGALKDIRDKNIVMLHPRPIIGTFDRVIKYVQKGYSIAVPDLVIASVRLLDSIYKDRLEAKTMRLLDRNYEYDRSIGGDYLGFFGEEPEVL